MYRTIADAKESGCQMLLDAVPRPPQCCDIEPHTWIGLKLGHSWRNGHSRYANHGYAFRYIARHNRIGADGCLVANLDSAEDGDAPSQPDLLADGDRFCSKTRVAKGSIGLAGMICITNAGVFTDHAAFSDRHPGHRYDVGAARNNEPIAQLDASISLGFQMDVGVQQHMLPYVDATGAVD